MFKHGLLYSIRVDLTAFFGTRVICQKGFNCLRFSLGSITEFVFVDLFHGSLETGNTKYRHKRIGTGFPSA